MWLVALRHTEMATEVAAFRVAVPSAMVSVLGSSPSNTTRTEVVSELAYSKDLRPFARTLAQSGLASRSSG
jgi:hypothetical protein